jgi:Dolichyl-phosphate-mannose-protein mannosyltransferase
MLDRARPQIVHVHRIAPAQRATSLGPPLERRGFLPPSRAAAPAAIEALDVDGFGLSQTEQRRVAQATLVFVALGVALRLLRYLLRFPIWGDEAYIATNLFEQSYADLLQPLAYHQVCAPLFLWAELTSVRLLGFSEYSLRLLPCLASVASLLLFWRLARGVLRGVPLMLAVGMFAVAYFPIRHGGEVKPYATDLFTAMLLLTIFSEWLRRARDARWLWLLVAVVPLAIWLSYPAVFVAGGVGLALVWPAWKSGRTSTRLAMLVYGAVLIAAFGGLLYLTAQAQYAREYGAGGMSDYWREAFPPLGRPLALIGWLVREHTGFTFAYPVGGRNGASALTFVCFVAGAIALWRAGRRTLLLACLAPFALAFVAAAMHRYPYGGSARVMLYLAPAICLLAGLGATTLLALGRDARLRRAGMAISVALLSLLALGQGVRDLVEPYKTIYDQRDRAFADWLWNDKAHGVEMVCVYRDLGLDFFPLNWEWGHSARYLSNQRIYSPRHRGPGKQPDWDAISAERPLVCVVYWVGDLKRDDAAFARWMEEVGARFELADQERHVLNPDSGYTETYELYTFVPRVPAAATAGRSAAPSTSQQR